MIILRTLLFATGAIFLIIFFYCFIRRRSQFSSLFAVLSLAIMVYALGYAFELGAKNIDEIKFWLKVEYFGLAFLPTFWFLFAYKTQYKRNPTFQLNFAMFAIPVLTLFFCVTNEYHHFYYREVSAVFVNNHPLAVLEKGPWYVVFIIYSNVTLLGSLYVFFRQWRTSNQGISSRGFWMMMGALSVMAFQLIYHLGLSPYDIDLTPFGLLVAALFQLVVIIRYDFLKADELVKDIVFSGISEGIIILDANGRISDYNKAGGLVFSWLHADAVGKKITEFPEGGELGKAASHGRELKLEVAGRPRYFDVKRTELVEGGKAVGSVFMFKDVTAMHRLFKRLYRFANYDMLTRIFNRHRFFDDAEKETARVRRYGGTMALLMIDLDFFKDVNDLHGHMAGDEVLAAVAQTLKKRIRSSDILGRYGGEEFVIVLASVDAGKALTVAEAIRRSVAELRVEHGGTSIPITVSVGVAVSGEDSAELTLETLLVQADRALYRAKREGRNRVACWTRGLDA